MTQLLKKLFYKQEQQEAVHPPSSSQYDDGYITYCVEQEIAIARLESALHKSDSPDEIAVQTLKTACDFYGANWAGIIELDLELGVTTPGWWYNTDPTIRKLQRMSEFENLSPMQTWKESIRSGDPIIIPDVAEVSRASPLEYPVYKRMGVDALFTNYKRAATFCQGDMSPTIAQIVCSKKPDNLCTAKRSPFA